MKCKYLALTVLLLASATAALADPVDPQGRVGGGGGGSSGIPITTAINTIVLTSPMFNFTSNGNGGGVFVFTNGSSVAFNQIIFTAVIVAPQQLQLLCGTVPGLTELFANCQFTVTQLPGGKDRITLAFFGLQEQGEPPLPGVPVGGTFTVSLNNGGSLNPNGKGGWDPNNTVHGMGSPSVVPEPATIALTLSGLGALLAARKRRQNR